MSPSNGQNKICDGRVLVHATKRLAVITKHRALVVLRFLLKRTVQTHRFRLILTTC
jgi:hypothetical protein